MPDPGQPVRLGLELRDARIIGVIVTDEGVVRARASHDGTSDVAAAVRTVIGSVKSGSDGPMAAGVASANLDAPADAVVAALRTEGIAPSDVVMSSGTAAAVAESWIGAAAGARDVVFFAVDDRTTGGIVRDGAPVLGARGRASSFGWLSLNPVEREDYRKIGCLEAEVAAAGIVRRLVWRIKAGDRSRVQDVVAGELAAITIDHVLAAARDGDGVSISVMRDTAKYLGMAAANMIAVTDPNVLVIGGIMASASDLLVEAVRAEVSRRLPRSLVEGLSIVPAKLGVDAAAIGAARLAASVLQ